MIDLKDESIKILKSDKSIKQKCIDHLILLYEILPETTSSILIFSVLFFSFTIYTIINSTNIRINEIFGILNSQKTFASILLFISINIIACCLLQNLFYKKIVPFITNSNYLNADLKIKLLKAINNDDSDFRVTWNGFKIYFQIFWVTIIIPAIASLLYISAHILSNSTNSKIIIIYFTEIIFTFVFILTLINLFKPSLIKNELLLHQFILTCISLTSTFFLSNIFFEGFFPFIFPILLIASIHFTYFSIYNKILPPSGKKKDRLYSLIMFEISMIYPGFLLCIFINVVKITGMFYLDEAYIYLPETNQIEGRYYIIAETNKHIIYRDNETKHLMKKPIDKYLTSSEILSRTNEHNNPKDS